MISEIFGFVCEPIVHILGTERSQRRGHIAFFLSLRPFFRLYLLLLFLFQSIFNSINTIFRAFSLHKLFLRRWILRRPLLLRFFLRRFSHTGDFVEGVFVVFQLAVLPANPLPGQIIVGFQLVQRRPDGGNPILGVAASPAMEKSHSGGRLRMMENRPMAFRDSRVSRRCWVRITVKSLSFGARTTGIVHRLSQAGMSCFTTPPAAF